MLLFERVVLWLRTWDPASSNASTSLFHRRRVRGSSGFRHVLRTAGWLFQKHVSMVECGVCAMIMDGSCESILGKQIAGTLCGARDVSQC